MMTSADNGQLLARRLLCLSLMLAVVSSIPFTVDDGIMQPLSRASLMAAAFLPLIHAGLTGRASITAALRLFPLPLAVYLAWSAASIAWSLAPGVSAFRVSESILTFIYFQCFILVMGTVCRSVKECMEITALAFGGAAAVGLLINVAVFGTPLHFWLNPDVPDRPRFTFGYLHPLGAGDILAIGIIAAAFTQWRLAAKAVLGAALFALLLLSDSTGARLAVVALLGIGVLLIGTDVRQHLSRFMAAGAAACIILLVALGAGESAIVELGNPENTRVLTLTGRVHIWSVIFDHGLAFTPFGYGFEAARNVITPLVGRSYHAHNLFLNILVETGIAGFLIFAWLAGAWLWRLVQQGGLVAWLLFAYSMMLAMNNPGMFTKQTMSYVFLLSYLLPALYPRWQLLREPLQAPAQSVAA